MDEQKPSRRDRRSSAKSKKERAEFFRQLNESYAQLKKDPEAWAEYQSELKLWDTTIADGLGPDI